MDMIGSSCANLKYLTRLQDPAKVRSLSLKFFFLIYTRHFRDFMLVKEMIVMVTHVLPRSISDWNRSWRVYLKIPHASMLWLLSLVWWSLSKQRLIRLSSVLLLIYSVHWQDCITINILDFNISSNSNVWHDHIRNSVRSFLIACVQLRSMIRSLLHWKISAISTFVSIWSPLESRSILLHHPDWFWTLVPASFHVPVSRKIFYRFYSFVISFIK